MPLRREEKMTERRRAGKIDEMSLGLRNNEACLKLKHKLVCTNYPLQSTEEQTVENIEMYQETLQHLYRLWTVACQERDEARDQLQKSVAELSELKKLINSFLLPETDNNLDNHFFDNNLSPFSLTSPLDFVSLNGSSPGMSSATLSDSSTYGLIPPADFVQKTDRSVQTSIFRSGTDSCAPTVIDNLVRGKVLPEKGKLLQAVMEAGPLLESLLITGPVPKWRNPPTLPVSPVQVNRDRGLFNQKTGFGQKTQNFLQSSDSSLGRKRVSPVMHHQSLPGRRTRFQ